MVLFTLALAGRTRADDSSSVALSNGRGAFISFSGDENGNWRWTNLGIPGDLSDGRTVFEASTEIATNEVTAMLNPGWTLVENNSDRLVFEQEVPDAALRVRRIFSFGPAANVVRLETWVQSTGGEKTLARVCFADLQVAGEDFHETGGAPSSFPVFGQSIFAGIEHVSGSAQAVGEAFNLVQTPHLKVGEEWQFVAAVVVGWVPADGFAPAPNESPIRAAFLRYLDTVRIIPERIELHTNTWWTLPLPFAEKDVLKDIDALRAGFYDRTGMFFDSYALDLGWSNTKSVWRVDAKRFPNELHTINDRLSALDCKLGLWISPGSAYPEGLDNAWLKAQGYEVTPWTGQLANVACFAAGTRYEQTVKDSILDYAVRYGLGHVKLDFMNHACDVPTHGHPVGQASSYAIDAGLADVLDSLRAARPGIVLEPLTCGYPPSPWWTMHTPFVLGPDGDDVPYGRVASPEWMESLITARDIAYRASQESWIMPTQALETFDIVVQCPGDFQNMAVMAIGRGRWFISTYLKPELMKPTDWDFLAAMVRWERANKQYLGNAVMFGGKPENREAYGYAFHNPDKNIYCVRNPWIESCSVPLPASTNPSGPRELRMIYPRHATLARIEAGAEMPSITLAPYETVLLETVPAGDESALTPLAEPPVAGLDAGEPGVAPQVMSNSPALHFSWNGTITNTSESSAELCVLVQGSPAVSGATGYVRLSDRTVNLRKVTSEGQFGAALDASPDHWTWFLVTVPAGEQSFQIDLDLPLKEASVGVYLRGTTAALHDDATAGDGPAFPGYRPEQVAWSQTLLPAKTYVSDIDPGTPDDFFW